MVEQSTESAELKIREANINDLKALRFFEQKVVEAERPFNSAIRDEGVVYYDLEGLMQDDKSLLICVESTGKVVASGYLQIRASKTHFKHELHGYLGFMYVCPEFRGRGINGLVTQHLISWASAKGISTYYLEVYNDNAAAIRAYEKIGFKPLMLEMKLDT